MIGDIAKSLGLSFFVARLIAAAILVYAQAVLVFTKTLRMPADAFWRVPGLPDYAVPVALTFLCAILMNGFQVQIIKVYEGYRFVQVGFAGGALLAASCAVWRWSPWRHALPVFLAISGAVLLLGWAAHWLLLAYHRRTAKRLDEAMKRDRAKGVDTRAREHHRSRRYPPAGAELPTKLGNAIRAFEYHAQIYAIDPITMWYRLAAVIPDSFQQKLEGAETAFCFVLNLSLVFQALAVEALAIAVVNPVARAGFLALAVAEAVVAVVLYRAACTAAQDWGEYVRSAFDLYRLDLLNQFGVSLPPRPLTIEEERAVWKSVQSLTFYAKAPAGGVRFFSHSLDPDRLAKLQQALPTGQPGGAMKPPLNDAFSSVATAVAMVSQQVRICVWDPFAVVPDNFDQCSFSALGVHTPVEVEAFRQALVRTVPEPARAGVLNLDLRPELVVGLVVGQVANLFAASLPGEVIPPPPEATKAG
jgi:hypothetical protein